MVFEYMAATSSADMSTPPVLASAALPKERLEATPDLLRFVFFFGLASSSSLSDAMSAAPLERRRRPLGLGLGASVAAAVGSSSSSSELASARADMPLSLLLRRAGMVCFDARRAIWGPNVCKRLLVVT